MAKKKETKETMEETPMVVETPVVETPKKKTKSHPEDGWKIKNK